MGLFDSISSKLGGNDKESSGGIDWKMVDSAEDIDDLLSSNSSGIRILFKHSPRCATSFFARNDLEKFPADQKPGLDFYMVDVIGNRDISMHIAERLGIRHESPQLFVLKGEEVLWHGSHHRVQTDNIIQAIESL